MTEYFVYDLAESMEVYEQSKDDAGAVVYYLVGSKGYVAMRPVDLLWLAQLTEEEEKISLEYMNVTGELTLDSMTKAQAKFLTKKSDVIETNNYIFKL